MKLNISIKQLNLILGQFCGFTDYGLSSQTPNEKNISQEINSASKRQYTSKILDFNRLKLRLAKLYQSDV